MPATTWDTNNKGAGVTLSGGSLVATITTGTQMCAATRTITGLSYFEVTATTLNNILAVGMVNRVAGVNTLLGADLNSIGYKNSGVVTINNITITTIQTFIQGDVVCVAVNPIERLIWFRTNAGNWNNSGTANPATNTGGITYATTSMAALIPACGGTFSAGNIVWTANFTGTFAQTPPSGYSSVDTIQNPNSMTNGILKSGPDNQVQYSTYPRRAFMFGANYAYTVWTGAPGTGQTIKNISGVVSESGTPVANKLVRLYDRNTGEFLGSAISAGDGSFSIYAKGRTSTFAVAFDVGYNALVYDNVTPV